MKRLEVRCCCRPAKLLGTLEVRDDMAHEGAHVTFLLPEVQPVQDFLASSSMTKVSAITFDVMAWGHFFEPKGIALRHDNIELETLRRIPGFIEA